MAADGWASHHLGTAGDEIRFVTKRFQQGPIPGRARSGTATLLGFRRIRLFGSSGSIRILASPTIWGERAPG